MLRTLVTVIVVWLSGSRCFSQSTTVANWLLTHALHGNVNYEVLAQRTVDVTFDGKPETLIAFEDKTDRTAPVPFFIVGTTSRHHQTILFRNDDVVQCQQCGGIFTDRGSFAVGSRGVITFSGQYSSRQRGYHFLSLRFDPVSKRWLVWKAGDVIACEYTIKNKRIRGLIPETALIKLVVSELTHEEYAVTVPKAHFYAAPNSTARSNLFVLKGDSLHCTYKVKGYTYCSFEKESHDTVNTLYYGFFRDEALTVR